MEVNRQLNFFTIANGSLKQLVAEANIEIKKISHMFMSLAASIDTNTIQAWLVHISLETINHYAKTDLKMKAQALQKCAVRGANSATQCAANWQSDSDLMVFLTSL